MAWICLLIVVIVVSDFLKARRAKHWDRWRTEREARDVELSWQ
jgi:hypothetical protein